MAGSRAWKTYCSTQQLLIFLWNQVRKRLSLLIYCAIWKTEQQLISRNVKSYCFHSEICFPDIPGFIEPLLQLQTDTSLFVASAANETLAHVLLLLHQPSSVGSNNTEEHDDEHAQTSTTTDEFTVLSEYLTESLVPGDNARLHQSLQTLRLLAVLLSQAGPPLRDMLLQTVLDPLEELVKADCSLLTLSLMDAIMAAHR